MGMLGNVNMGKAKRPALSGIPENAEPFEILLNKITPTPSS